MKNLIKVPRSRQTFFSGILQRDHLRLYKHDRHNDALPERTGEKTSISGNTAMHRSQTDHSTRKSKAGKRNNMRVISLVFLYPVFEKVTISRKYELSRRQILVVRKPNSISKVDESRHWIFICAFQIGNSISIIVLLPVLLFFTRTLNLSSNSTTWFRRNGYWKWIFFF